MSTHKPLTWLRYIDDIFIVWTHGRDLLNKFLDLANSFHPTIKFSSYSSSEQVPFLDVMVSLEDGFLQTDLYSKPTDTFSYLHWTSCHPFHTRKSIPYSLAFRLVRLCSSAKRLSVRLSEMTEHLISRGFPKKHIDSAIQKACQSSRTQALKRKNPLKKQNRIPFVVTYNPALPNIASILHTFFPILQTSDSCKEAIPNVPMVSFRKPKNLRNILVRASTSPNTTHRSKEAGFEPCSTSRCKTCQHTTKTNSFMSHANNKRFDLYHFLSCYSFNLIYLITCLKCNKQYVGQTEQTLRQRMNGHRHSIIHKIDTPVARHFNLAGHSIDHLHIIGIDLLPSADLYTRLNKETFWIYTLKTLEPHGINVQEQTSFPIAHRFPKC